MKSSTGINWGDIVFLKEYSEDYQVFKDSKFIKVIEIDYISADLPSDSHWIFTSKNSLAAIKKLLSERETAAHAEGTKPASLPSKSQNVYCLGQKSNSLAAEIFKDRVIYGKEALDSEELAKLIVRQEQEWSDCELKKRSVDDCTLILRSYVFFTGDKSLQTLPAILQQNGIPCKQIQVYSTRILSIDCNCLDNKIVVLFSPSGLQSLESIADLNCRWIAIGKTTGKALNNCGIRKYYVSKAPTPEGLMNAILECVNDETPRAE